MVKQEFDIDIGSKYSPVLEDQKVLQGMTSLSSYVKSQLIEGYSPILNRFAEIYQEVTTQSKDQDQIKFTNEQKSELSEMLYNHFRLSLIQGRLANDIEIEEFLNEKETLNPNPNQNINRHLGYLYNAITVADMPIVPVAGKLNELFQGQFDTDFLLRNKIILIDTKGKLLYDGKDINGIIIADLELDTSLTQKQRNLFEQRFIEMSGCSPAQMQFIKARYNQRSIVGIGSVLGVEAEDGSTNNVLPSDDPIKAFWVVNLDENNKPTLLEVNIETKVCNFVNDQKLPYATISYKADLRSLVEIPVEYPYILPVQKIPETLTVGVLNSPENKFYPIPQCLKHRTKNNMLLSLGRDLELHEIKEVLDTPGIEHELLADNAVKLLNLARTLQSNNLPNKDLKENLVKLIYSEEIKNAIDFNLSRASNKVLARQVKENLRGKLNIETNTKDLEKLIFEHLKLENPQTFEKLTNPIKAAVLRSNSQKYRAENSIIKTNEVTGKINSLLKQNVSALDSDDDYKSEGDGFQKTSSTRRATIAGTVGEIISNSNTTPNRRPAFSIRKMFFREKPDVHDNDGFSKI
jgi:hypothetical protein